jgi:hypothetical protein
VYVSQTEFPFWNEMVALLENQGRHDLVEGLQPAMSRFWGETGWKGRLKRFDRLHLNGGLQTLERALRGRRGHRTTSKTHP